MAVGLLSLWVLMTWAAQATAMFAIVYVAARLAIRHERR